MWEYLAVLLTGFWLGVAIFLYVSCYWLEEIFGLPPPRNASPGASSSHSQQATSGASGAHAHLKRLVARVVEEAAALPALARYAAEPSPTPPLDTSTYEDLLATAILNKVIERYQNESGSGGRSSGIHSASASPSPSDRSSPRSLNSRHTRHVTPVLQEEEDDVSDWEEGDAAEDAIDLPRRVPFPEFGGDIVHHTDNEDRDFDEVSGSDIQAVDGTWEENWLFQKKKIKTIQSVPVPMLVPNSNAEYRALIGDRDADDTTDLSDNASDPEEDQAEYKSDMKKVLDSKHIIGGKPKVDEILDFEPDSLTIIDGSEDFEKYDEEEYMKSKNLVHAVNSEIDENSLSVIEKTNTVTEKTDNSNDSILIVGINSGPLSTTEFSLKEEIHRTILNGNTEKYNDLNTKTNGEVYKDIMCNLPNNKGSTNTISHHEREGEYEETVAKPVQRYADSLRRKHFDDDPQRIPTRDTDKEEDLIPGSIAYRERKKWLNYVEMPNNPYSPEAIQKRLTAKSTSSLFDMLTTKDQDFDDDKIEVSENIINGDENLNKEIEEYDIPVKDEVKSKPALNLNIDNANINGIAPKSPSPRILKDVLAEEVPQYKRYGRDYYIKEAKASSGGRKRSNYSETSSVSSMNKSTSLENFDTEFTSPELLIKQFNTIAKTEQYKIFAALNQTSVSITTKANNKTDILIEYEDFSEPTLFAAKPALVDDHTDNTFEQIFQTVYNSEINKIPDESQKSPTNISSDNSYLSSSSLEDSIKIYNVQTGEILKSKPYKPYDNVSSRYVDRNDNIDISDKNSRKEKVDRLSLNGDVNEVTVIIENLAEEQETSAKSELDEVLPQLPKVKELAKKFVSMENSNGTVKPSQKLSLSKSKENLLNDTRTDKPTPKYVHSLTARSVTKEFREELKYSPNTPQNTPEPLDLNSKEMSDNLLEPPQAFGNGIDMDSKEGQNKSLIQELKKELKLVAETPVKTSEQLNNTPNGFVEHNRNKTKEINAETKTEKPKPKYVHSITARSINKEIREELKQSLEASEKTSEEPIEAPVTTSVVVNVTPSRPSKVEVTLTTTSGIVEEKPTKSSELTVSNGVEEAPQEIWRRMSRESILSSDSKSEKTKQLYMHSLTARSISKEFREELKMSMPTHLNTPGGSKEIPEGIEEVVKENSRPGSPQPEPGTIKTKLAFFESLKSKFSNNSGKNKAK